MHKKEIMDFQTEKASHKQVILASSYGTARNRICMKLLKEKYFIKSIHLSTIQSLSTQKGKGKKNC